MPLAPVGAMMLNTLKQLFIIDQKTGRPSHTKMWSNVGYAAATFAFVYAVVVHNATDPLLWAMYIGGIVGNYSVSRWLIGKTNKEQDK